MKQNVQQQHKIRKICHNHMIQCHSITTSHNSITTLNHNPNYSLDSRFFLSLFGWWWSGMLWLVLVFLLFFLFGFEEEGMESAVSAFLETKATSTTPVTNPAMTSSLNTCCSVSAVGSRWDWSGVLGCIKTWNAASFTANTAAKIMATMPHTSPHCCSGQFKHILVQVCRWPKGVGTDMSHTKGPQNRCSKGPTLMRETPFQRITIIVRRSMSITTTVQWQPDFFDEELKVDPSPFLPTLKNTHDIRQMFNSIPPHIQNKRYTPNV